MQIEPKRAIDCARVEIAVHCRRCLRQQCAELGARVRGHTHARAVVCKVQGFAIRLVERYSEPVCSEHCVPVRGGLVAAVAGVTQFFEGIDERSCRDGVWRNIVNHSEAAVCAQAAHTLAYKLARCGKMMRSQPAGDGVKAGIRKRELRCIVQHKCCCLRTALMQETARGQ